MQTRTQNKPDSGLRAAVAMHIDWEPEVTSGDISVAAHDGVVTLTGFVHHVREKIAAEKAARSVHGVSAVANDIEVRTRAERTDREIARDIVRAMRADVTVPDTRIRVGVKDGDVDLEGVLDWNFQRTAAAACARRVAGVRDVANNITLRPSAAPNEMQSRIERALRDSATLDARRITVGVADGTAHLYGSVGSWAERDEAERAVWATSGVSSVVNHLAVVA